MFDSYCSYYLIGNGRTGRFAVERWMNLADPVEVSQYMKSRKLKKKTCLHTASKGNIKTNLKHSDYELVVSVSEDS